MLPCDNVRNSGRNGWNWPWISVLLSDRTMQKSSSTARCMSQNSTTPLCSVAAMLLALCGLKDTEVTGERTIAFGTPLSSAADLGARLTRVARDFASSRRTLPSASPTAMSPVTGSGGAEMLVMRADRRSTRNVLPVPSSVRSMAESPRTQ